LPVGLPVPGAILRAENSTSGTAAQMFGIKPTRWANLGVF
jgi:hypothetical protein